MAGKQDRFRVVTVLHPQDDGYFGPEVLESHEIHDVCVVRASSPETACLVAAQNFRTFGLSLGDILVYREAPNGDWEPVEV